MKLTSSALPQSQGNMADVQPPRSSIFSSAQPIALGIPHLLNPWEAFPSPKPRAWRSPFGCQCCGRESFCCKFPTTPLQTSKHLLLRNTACCREAQAPSNAEYKESHTRVPRADVIMSASGLLDNPKSATFALHLFSRLTMKTLRDLRSRWMTGGFMKCNAAIPLAMSRAIAILSRQLKLI